MRVDLTICEIDNLLMMYEAVNKTGRYDGEFSRSAVRKLNKAHKDYIALYDIRDSGAEVDAMLEQGFDFTGGKEQ